MSSEASELTDEDLAKLDWIHLQRDMDRIVPTESRNERFFRKVGENPFVPIGVLATTAALGYGIWSFRTGERKMSQYMMRTRIAAQGFTILAMLVGISMGTSKL